MRAAKGALAVLAVVALTAMPFAAAASEASGQESYEIYAWDQLKDKLMNNDPSILRIADDIVIPADIYINLGYVVVVEEGKTLTVGQYATATNQGRLEVHGTFQVDGRFINDLRGSNPGVVAISGGTFTGSCGLVLDSLSTGQNGTATHEIDVNSQLNDEKVTLICKTLTDGYGYYTYATELDEWRYTISIDDSYSHQYYVKDAGQLLVWKSGAVAPSSDDDLDESAAVPLAAAIIVIAALMLATTVFARRK